MPLFSLADLEEAATLVHSMMRATPAYAWPLLSRRAGVQVVVKHENHTPTGSFKARGGLVYIEALRKSGKLPHGLVTATRGNHGQSIAIGASRAGIPALIVVPEGNSAEKNAAMEAFGGEIIVGG
ncbi:MAG: pyridoxal-phosphate dependent enzyme, partial [Halioglobus sp.]|nr:pyridoxal-phosphate dependent enzyme [Halioglobus sp.]